MQKTIKKELSFSLDTLERYRAKYGRSASSDTNGHGLPMADISHTTTAIAAATAPATTVARPPPASLFKPQSPPKMTKLQELQQKKEAYMRAREHEKEMEQLQRASNGTASLEPTKHSSNTSNTNNMNGNSSSSSVNGNSSSTVAKSSASSPSSAVVATTQQASKTAAGYTNWGSNHTTLSSLAWCAISDLMYFCDKYEFKTLSTRDLKTHQEIVAEVRALLCSKSPFDQRTRFPGNIHDPENLWVCIGRCASVEYHLQRIISIFRKPLNQLTPDKQRTVRQNFHLAVSELRLDISARISEVRLYDRLVFEREFRLEWQDEA